MGEATCGFDFRKAFLVGFPLTRGTLKSKLP
jgi:hypothetical protein